MKGYLGRNARDQAVERTQLGLAAEVEALEEVVSERGHLTVFAAQQLLQRRGGVRVRFLRGWQLGLKSIDS